MRRHWTQALQGEPARRQAVEGLGDFDGQGHFAYVNGAGQQVGVGQLAGLQPGFQLAEDVFLAYYSPHDFLPGVFQIDGNDERHESGEALER